MNYHNGRLPGSSDVPVQALAGLFADRTTSYKYLFFDSILEALKEKSFHCQRLTVQELARGMVAKAWYPVRIFKLSFGHQDQIAQFIQDKLAIGDSPIPRNQLRAAISEALIDHQALVRYVPYRLLAPFFAEDLRGLRDQIKNAAIRALAASKFDIVKPLYRFVDDETIELHPSWIDYLSRNFAIVTGWTEWNWISFLESRNPSVPALSHKGGAPHRRSSLSIKVQLWKEILRGMGPDARCIYSRRVLNLTNLHLDHVLPWTFVCHDSHWNLMPVLPEANMSKGNCLPDPKYLSDVSEFHYRALSYTRASMAGRWRDMALSYTGDLRISEEELNNKEKFKHAYVRAVRPQLDAALNLGFSGNWRWRDPRRG